MFENATRVRRKDIAALAAPFPPGTQPVAGWGGSPI